jgi:hypothetical protein
MPSVRMTIAIVSSMRVKPSSSRRRAIRGGGRHDRAPFLRAMSSTRLYDSFVEVGPFRFTGSVTWRSGRLFVGLSTPLRAVLELGRQKGVDVVR